MPVTTPQTSRKARRSRRKGAEFEREIVRKLGAEDIDAERIGIAYAPGEDINLYPFGREAEAVVAQCKVRKDGEGFKQIERWLNAADILFLKRDRQQPFVVLRWDVLIRIFKAAKET